MQPFDCMARVNNALSMLCFDNTAHGNDECGRYLQYIKGLYNSGNYWIVDWLRTKCVLPGDDGHPGNSLGPIVYGESHELPGTFTRSF